MKPYAFRTGIAFLAGLALTGVMSFHAGQASAQDGQFPWESKPGSVYHSSYSRVLVFGWSYGSGYAYVLTPEGGCQLERRKGSGKLNAKKPEPTEVINCAPMIIADRVKERFGACPVTKTELPGSPSSKNGAYDGNFAGMVHVTTEEHTLNLNADCLGYREDDSRTAWQDGAEPNFDHNASYLTWGEYLSFFPESERAEITQIAQRTNAEIQALDEVAAP